MKSTISKQPCKATLPFPKLMQSVTGIVVLFNDYMCGVVVSSNEGSAFYLGYHCESWNMSIFKDFNGSVCLENDK